MGHPSAQGPNILPHSVHSAFKTSLVQNCISCFCPQPCCQTSVSSNFSAHVGMRESGRSPTIHRLSFISTGFLLCPWGSCTLSSICIIRRASPGVRWPDVLLIHLAMLLKPVFFMSHTCLPVSLTPMVIAVLKTHLLQGPACREECQA